MKRQNIRKALILIGFILFPLLLYFFSPYLIIQATLEGIISGSFVIFVVMFITSLFFGRAYCGWLCPAGGLQECCMMVTDKRARGGRYNWIKYFIWVPWISLIAILAVSIGGYRSIQVFYQLNNGFTTQSVLLYLIIYYTVVSLIVVLSFTAGKRAFCHYVCWMAPFMVIGTKLKAVLKYPSLHLAVNNERCIQCKQCSKKCPMSLEVKAMVNKGSMNNAECILCGECIDICPKKVIRYSIK